MHPEQYPSHSNIAPPTAEELRRLAGEQQMLENLSEGMPPQPTDVEAALDPAAEQARHDADVAAARFQVEQALGSDADRTIDRSARTTRDNLKELGLDRVAKDEITKETVAVGGAELADTAKTQTVEDTVIGKETVTALADGKPGSKKLRERIKELGSHPAEVKTLLNAVSRQKNGERVSQQALEIVGRRLRRSQRKSRTA